METLKIIIYVLMASSICSLILARIFYLSEKESQKPIVKHVMNLVIIFIGLSLILSLIFLISSHELYNNGQKDALIGKQKYTLEFTYEKIDTVLMIEDESIFITPRDTFFDISFSPKDTSYFVIKDTIFKLKEEKNDTNN